jgi:hypothetical protein
MQFIERVIIKEWQLLSQTASVDGHHDFGQFHDFWSFVAFFFS